MKFVRTHARRHVPVASLLAVVATLLSFATAFAGTGPGPWPK